MSSQHAPARRTKPRSRPASLALFCAALFAALCLPVLAATGARAGQGKFKPRGPKAEAGGGVRALALGCANATPTINSGALINGALQPGDCTNPIDGSLYDAYRFTGTAGQQVTIDMTSSAFDPYLYLMRPGETTISPDPNVTVQDDDSGGGTSARISITLPSNGTYTILADSYSNGITPSGTGAYTLALTLTGAGPPGLRLDTVTPPAGRSSGGQQVKLIGWFPNLSSVAFGGVAAAWSYSSGTTEITITTPAHAVGAVSIDLTPTSGSPYSKPNAFAYLPTVFTDDTLVAGATTVKAQHITELRQAVDALRAVAGLGPAPWTNATLVPGSVKAAHVAEVRTYLEDAAARLGYASASYTDASLTGLVIKRIHIEELRQRIRNIAG